MSKAIESSEPMPATASSVSRRNSGYTFWLLWFANFMNYADRYAFLALGPAIITEFHINKFVYGLTASGFLIVYTFSILPLGLLADRIKRKNVVAGGMTFWSLITGVTAIAPNFASLFATRAMLGVGEGSYFPASTSMLASSFPKNQRARVMSRWNTGLLVGLGIGYIGAGILLGVFNGQWRPVFYVFAIPGLVLALLIFLMKEPPRHADDDEVNVEAAIAREGLAGIRRSLGELWQIASVRVIVAEQALSFFVYAASITFVNVLITDILTKQQLNDLPLSVDTLIGVGAVVGGITGLLAGGAIADRLIVRIPGARVLVSGWSFLISVPFFVATILVLILDLGVSPNVRILGLFFPLFTVTLALLQINSGPLTAVSQDVVQPLKRAASVGLTLLLSHFLGIYSRRRSLAYWQLFSRVILCLASRSPPIIHLDLHS